MLTQTDAQSKPLSQPRRTATLAGRGARFWKILCLFFLVMALMVLSRDIIPCVLLQVARHGMGQFTDRQQYFQAVERTTNQWIVSHRETPMTNQTRLLILDDIRDQRQGNPLHNSWPYAMLAEGLDNAYNVSHNPDDLHSLTIYCDKLIAEEDLANEQHLLRVLDQAMIGTTLLDLQAQRKKPHYRAAIENIATYLLTRSQRAGGGTATLAYREGDPVRLVDTLGMICPFLMRYAVTYASPEARALAIAQLKEYNRYGIEPRSGLLFHGYNPAAGNAPVGVIGWGRGSGWYGIGLVDTLAYMPQSDPERAELEGAFRRFAQLAVQTQWPDGGWGTMLGAPSEFDSSATAMIAYSLQRAQNLHIITGNSYREAIASAIRALQQHTHADGTVDFAQGVVQDINIHSSLYEPAAYAQGMTLALLAACQQAPDCLAQR